jgi:hypothetical protein
VDSRAPFDKLGAQDRRSALLDLTPGEIIDKPQPDGLFSVNPKVLIDAIAVIGKVEAPSLIRDERKGDIYKCPEFVINTIREYISIFSLDIHSYI